jgi:hypothetical protein
MKSKIFVTVILSMVMVTATIVSCDKSLDETEQLKPLKPANVDADAGTWTMILLSSPTQIAVPQPTDVTSDAYKAELAAIKDAQSKLTSDQRKIIKYWSGGGILRWNQIFRELVAKYNLPPEPVNGAYPAPDAENPFSFPQFPFSNPPYAARAYSYVSAAQYDALKAAWHYKNQYQRPAPYKVDSGIKSLMPESELFAYPSEEAVMSGAAAEILKVMFPASVEDITLKAAEQRNAAFWSGKATASDIAEGLALGKSVAGVFTTRARGDLMNKSGGNKALWKSLEENATNRGEIAWKSLETPSRPPMLPYFGMRTYDGQLVQLTGARAWMMTNEDIVAERPLPPPPTSSAEMKKEVEEVKWYSKHLTRERLAIVHKWADGVSTYTPQGHWNDIAEEFISDANYSEVRAARAFALLNIVMHDAGVACWDAKFFYFNPRPSQLDASIKTATGVPNFPAYVSGHSTFSASACAVLSHFFPAHAAEFKAMSDEAAMSRLYGGIHYRSDCDAGSTLGERVASYTLNFAEQDGAEN